MYKHLMESLVDYCLIFCHIDFINQITNYVPFSSSLFFYEYSFMEISEF